MASRGGRGEVARAHHEDLSNTQDERENPGMSSRRVMRSMVVVAAFGMLLGGCLPFRPPIEAVPSPDGQASSTATASSTAGTSSASRTPTPTPAATPRAATDPFAGKRVDLKVGYAAPQKTTMPCGSGSSRMGVARAGSYVGFADQEVAGVFELAGGQWLWCAKTGFGGADGVAEVTTDSAVGRPGYQPSLDEDTLEAAEFDFNVTAFFLREADETLLVVPVTIDRPQIGSQKEAPLRGLVAFDGHGVKKWITGLPQTGKADVFCLADATACLLDQGSGSDAVIVAPDPESGELSTLAQGGRLRRYANPGPASSELFLFTNSKSQPVWARFEADAEWHLLTSESGKTLSTNGYVGVVQHWVVMAEGPNYSPTKIRRLDTTTGASDVVPFAFDKDSCLPLADRRLLCTDDGSKPSIGVFDVSTGEVVWEWQEDDPDPVTQVPRKVPRDLYVYGDLVFAKAGNSSERYLIDAKTGADVPFDPKMAVAYELLRSDACNSYGCVEYASGRIEYAQAK